MKLIDLGHTFGLAVGHIFRPWQATIVRPRTFNDFEEAVDDADMVIFGGGADIHPSLYKHNNVASYVGKGETPSYRDLFEKHAFKVAFEKKKPILGICRGAQLACALSGGFLVQDVRNHASASGRGDVGHNLTLEDGKEISFTTAHHQQMVPWNIEHNLIAWTKGNPLVTEFRWDHKAATLDQNRQLTTEPEIVFFPKTNTLAIQGHPEFVDDVMHPAVVYTRKLIKDKFGFGLNV